MRDILANAAPSILTDMSSIFTQAVVISGLTLAKCPLQQWLAPAHALEHKCRDHFYCIWSSDTSTGLEVSQAFTKPALFASKSGKERQIYLWDPFPSQEVPTRWAFWWLMPGDISEGTARIGAISMSPASIGGCLKQQLSRIFLQTWKPQSCADHFFFLISTLQMLFGKSPAFHYYSFYWTNTTQLGQHHNYYKSKCSIYTIASGTTWI